MRLKFACIVLRLFFKQVASLAIGTANGLILKGGHEAKHTNKYLYLLVKEALAIHNAESAVCLVSATTHASVCEATKVQLQFVCVFAQVSSREDVGTLLSMSNDIDLVIPRGSKELVQQIEEASRHIPVLGHSQGICHVFVDAAADHKKAIKIGARLRAFVSSEFLYLRSCALNENFGSWSH